jgi:drug/metabolite transporter (DMT)-like permease
LAGALFYALTVILFVLANKLTSAANAILLQYTGPIYVAIFSWMFLKEKVTKIDWIAIIAVGTTAVNLGNSEFPLRMLDRDFEGTFTFDTDVKFLPFGENE